MKAVVYENYGSPDVLELREVPTPVPADDEVLLKVHAVSINDWDWGLLGTDAFTDRLMFGLFKPRRKVLGSDIAGTIESVGRNVRRFQAGDEVFGDLSGRWGGFAEYVCAPDSKLALKPAGMSFAEAAAIPQAGMLALQGLRDIGKFKPGQRLLINGAGGGVGTFAIQIARQYDLEVTGVDNAGKLDLMRSLGFDKVIDYALEDFTGSAARYDLILDVKTNRPVLQYVRALNPGGSYVTVGGDMGRLFQVALAGPLTAMTMHRKMRLVVLKPNRDLPYLVELFEAGKIKPVMELFHTLSEVPDAMRYFGSSGHKGKVVITL